MVRISRAFLALVAVAALSLVGAGTSFASHASMKAKMDKLTVNITATGGTVWGKVSVDYMSNGKMHMGKVCKATKCTYSVPHMVKLHLSETPTDKTTWPFKNWKVTTGGHSKVHKGSKLAPFEIMGSTATVTATYIFR